MPTKFDPILQLDALRNGVRPQLAFSAASVSSARKWQQLARAALRDVIGFQDQKRVALIPRVVNEVDRGWCVRRKVVIRTSAASEMPVYVVIPKDIPGKLPCGLKERFKRHH